MLKPVKRDSKKPYLSPKLTIYGTVQELTKKIGLGGSLDNGLQPTRIRTHI
jgi:hypothetical protein